jgi:hypothetical protein
VQLIVRTGNRLVLLCGVVALAVSVVAMISAAWWQALTCALLGGILIATWTPRVTLTVDGPIATVAWSGLWKKRRRSFPLASIITVGAFQQIPGELNPSRNQVQILTTEGEIDIAVVETSGRAERIAAEIGAFLARN